jgi:hypothetical protein
MEPQEFQPEDAVLKTALRRALGKPSAPPELRSRIEAMLAAEHRKEQTKRALWRRPAFALISAAAVLLIGLGIAYQLINQGNEVPEYFAQAMVQAHEQDAALADHHRLPGVPADAPLSTVRAELRKHIGLPVLVAELGEGWKYEGASLTTVSGVPAAELFFTRGDASISIFSVSAAAAYINTSTSGDGTTYAQMENGHPISGFVQGGAIHCLVGSSKSGKLTLKEVTKLRDKLRGEVATADPFFYASYADSCGGH